MPEAFATCPAPVGALDEPSPTRREFRRSPRVRVCSRTHARDLVPAPLYGPSPIGGAAAGVGTSGAGLSSALRVVTHGNGAAPGSDVHSSRDGQREISPLTGAGPGSTAADPGGCKAPASPFGA